jgi:SAM-dependent methyltransferase
MVGTLEDIPSDDLFDTILYIDVLEHIEDDKHEVEAAAQHLRPGGHLVILAPAHQSLYTPFDAAIGHFRRYDKQSLSAVIPPNLTEKALFYVDSAGALASAGNKLVLRSDNPQARQIVFWDRVLIPISRKLDWLLCYNIGKSVIGIWRRI